MNASAQSTHQNFALHTLGWKAFQQLCTTIAGEIWGQSVQSFSDSNDGGRDIAFQAVSSGETFTVQCKFTARPGGTLSMSLLKTELQKAKRLAKNGLATNYILMTNLQISGRTDEEIRSTFGKLRGVKSVKTFGAEAISRIILEHPRLRMLVPRVYGLGDLSQIIDARKYDQALDVLSSIGEDLSKFVITEAYLDSAKAISEHGMVFLLGEPACGKSTIAATLAVSAIDLWKCPTLRISSAAEFAAHYNPHEPSQFFWIDDVFGATQLDWQAVNDWNKAFPLMTAAIRKGTKIIMTSRDYIYRNALRLLKTSALPGHEQSKVVIKVEHLSLMEKQQIVYNHIRLGNQPLPFRRSVKPYLSVVAQHPRFSPETARRLGNVEFTRGLTLSLTNINEFTENPMGMLQEVIRTLDRGPRAAIALVFIHGARLGSPIDLTTEDQKILNLFGASPEALREGLSALEGSLLLQARSEREHYWTFKHPTIGDAFASLILEDPELLTVYLAGAPASRLMSEVVCGRDYEGAKVLAPKSQYPLIARRLRELVGNRDFRDRLNLFLAYRCNAAFLTHFLETTPQFLSSLSIGSYFYAVSDVDVIATLHTENLLPEHERQRHVESLRTLAISIPDAGFIGKPIGQILTSTQYDELLNDIRKNVIFRLPEYIEDFEYNYDRDSDPTNHFSELVYALEKYKDTFGNEKSIVDRIERALQEISSVVERLELEGGPLDEDDNLSFRHDGISTAPGSTHFSIFDDVDEPI